MLKLWKNPMLSIDDRLAAADGEIDRLRTLLEKAAKRDTKWVDLVMDIGDSVKCLGSTSPDGNQHILRKLKERETRIANLEFGPEEA